MCTKLSYQTSTGVINTDLRTVTQRLHEDLASEMLALAEPEVRERASERFQTPLPVRMHMIYAVAYGRTGSLQEHTGPIRRVIRSAGNLCRWHRL